MPTTIGQHSVATFTSPVNGTTPIDANTVRGNDNTIRTSYNNHDSDPGIHVQSSTLASRPVAGTAGRKWITADAGSYKLWYDDGTRWHEIGNDAVDIEVVADETLAKGDVVSVTGYNNGLNLARVAKYTGAAPAFAIAAEAIANGAQGYVINTGLINDIDTNAFGAIGTILYPAATGTFTATKPVSGTYQTAAYVLRQASSGGALYVEFSAPRIVERSDNTASTVVLRDASGNFAAGTITAALTGNASTATTLQTARNINGVSFNGSADITVTADAGTLTGNTLAAGVTASSLTSVGTLTNLTVTNTITGSVSGSSGSTTGNAATATKLSSARTFAVTGDVTGSVSSDLTSGASIATAIAAGVIVDADINAAAEIAVSKLADGAARQVLQTDAAGTGVEWTNNVDLPGTLDVTGAATLDSTLSVAGQASLNGDVDLGNATSDTVSVTGRVDTDVVPSTDNARDLGTSALKWRQVYATTLTEGTSSVVAQTDIGSAPNEIPLNQTLGQMAFRDEVFYPVIAGTGITTGTGTVYGAAVSIQGGMKRVDIVVDLTGLNSGGTAGDIIGVNGTALPCHIGQLPSMAVLGGRMTCLEVPLGSDDDLDLYSATEGTGVEDQAITALTETQLVDAGGAWTLGLTKAFIADPTSAAFLYLVGQETGNATYTAGRFLIEIYGV
jgi:hypothetical protein